MRGPSRGFTLVEVLVALAVVGIVVAIISTASVSSIRNNATSGGRTQATQVLNFLGRLVAVGDGAIFEQTDLVWNYGELGTQFTDLAAEVGRTDPALYRAQVSTSSAAELGTVSMPFYEVEVCWQAPTASGESCVKGGTVGPVHDPGEDDPGPLPGII